MTETFINDIKVPLCCGVCKFAYRESLHYYRCTLKDNTPVHVEFGDYYVPAWCPLVMEKEGSEG